MKKVKQLLGLTLISTLLTGCAHFPDYAGGGSVWQGWLWVVPTLPAIGSAIYFVSAYRSKLNRTKYLKFAVALAVVSFAFWLGITLTA